MLKIRNIIKKIQKLFLLKLGNNKKVINYWQKKGAEIGENCTIYGNVNFGSEPFLIEIGNNVKITSNVNFITHDGGVHVIRNKYLEHDADLFRKIKVGNNVFIGYNVLILPGVTIGDNTILGAGSVVTKDVRSDAVYAGVPAKFICTIEEYYKKNKPYLEYTKKMESDDKKTYLENKYKLKVK